MYALANSDASQSQPARGREREDVDYAVGLQAMWSKPRRLTSTDAPVTVVQVTEDQPLARTREHLIRKAGLEVLTVSSRHHAESAAGVKLLLSFFANPYLGLPRSRLPTSFSSINGERSWCVLPSHLCSMRGTSTSCSALPWLLASLSRRRRAGRTSTRLPAAWARVSCTLRI